MLKHNQFSSFGPVASGVLFVVRFVDKWEHHNITRGACILGTSKIPVADVVLSQALSLYNDIKNGCYRPCQELEGLQGVCMYSVR